MTRKANEVKKSQGDIFRPTFSGGKENVCIVIVMFVEL